MSQTAVNLAPSNRLLWLAVAVVGLAFFLVEHDPFFSQRDEYYGAAAEDMEVSASAGRWANRMGYSLLAGLGGFFLARASGRSWRMDGLLPALLLFFVAWCLASTLWALDTGRTVRRLVSLVFCLVGALGLGRQLSGRALCQLILAITAVYAAVGVGMECVLRTFRPWSSEHRFAGTLHPNGQGLNCAFLCLSAALLLEGATRRRGLLIALFAGGALLLLLTKSRTSLAALLIALAAVRLLRPSPRFVALALGLSWTLGAVVLLVVLSSVDLPGQAARALTMGRSEDPGTLSGRTELWTELASYVRERPWTGYGYGGFWTAAHVQAVSSALYWGISSAHSAYVEAVLTIGLVGVTALGLVVLGGLGRAGRCYRRTADAGSGLLFGLLVYGIIGGLAESDLVLPTFSTFCTACGLSRLAFFHDQTAASP